MKSMDCSKNQVLYAQSEAETEEIGEMLGKSLKPDTVVAMYGGMGMGKTAMTRGIARGLGFFGRVTSPTFAIVNEYQGDIPIFHFDLFRLSGAEELYDIGFEEYLTRGGVLVIEWFENAEGVCQADIEITILPVLDNEDAREIQIRRR